MNVNMYVICWNYFKFHVIWCFCEPEVAENTLLVVTKIIIAGRFYDFSASYVHTVVLLFNLYLPTILFC